MNIKQNIPLSEHSTMRLGGNAAYLSEVTDKFQLNELVEWAKTKNLPVIMIGTGSNILWRDEGYRGLVLVNKITGFSTYTQDDDNIYITVGGGEVWDSVVARAAEQGLSGIEELSLIPGTAGATPVQNVGAYGREISETLTTIEAFDLKANQLVNLRASECGFGYRSSIFKTTQRGRYFITSITLKLSKTTPKPPFYKALEDYFADHNILEFTPQIIRDAVVTIRSAKLPDPKTTPNVGSFFANPIVTRAKFNELATEHPKIVHWLRDDETVKLSAAWLIDSAGFNGFHDPQTGMATWANQPLVFVNEHATNVTGLFKFKQKIVDAVHEKYGIELLQEPELLP